MLSLDQAVAALEAHTHVAARHDDCVFFFRQAHEALLLSVVIAKRLIAFDDVVILRHAVDSFDFVRNTVDLKV